MEARQNQCVLIRQMVSARRLPDGRYPSPRNFRMRLIISLAVAFAAWSFVARPLRENSKISAPVGSKTFVTDALPPVGPYGVITAPPAVPYATR